MSAKKPWAKPVIAPHRTGLSNKFGAAHRQQWAADIEGVPVADLLAKHGSPLFVISERRLRDNARRLYRAFSTRYPRVRFAWSYKTNYLGAVCAVFHQEGAWAEVVSEFEYQKARALGVPGERIVFNGPCKSRAALEVAVAEGALVQIDHLDELYALEGVARAAGRQVPVALRLNFDTGYTEAWSRFGFNLESGQAVEAVRRITASPHLRLIGLHSHMGTFILDTRAYVAQINILCGFMEKIEQETGCLIEFLDIGGGFASQNALQGIHLPPEQAAPAPEQYAEAICSALLAATQGRVRAGKPLPVLVLETGRAAVDSAEMLVSSVVANKRLPDGRCGVVLDAGVNLLFTAFWYHHAVMPTRPLDGLAEDTVLYGPLCMNIDVLRHSVMLPPLDVGDSLVFSHVGAYNNTQWMQFITLRPAVVMIGESGAVDVVREAETLQTVVSPERLPQRLTALFPGGLPD
ncbi:MAG: alanine racemase [Sulfuritalea sp.]|jgi:diaminopimelate decarboxylase|nr:alanine racemase [Sulfuritalea sp.]